MEAPSQRLNVLVRRAAVSAMGHTQLSLASRDSRDSEERNFRDVSRIQSDVAMTPGHLMVRAIYVDPKIIGHLHVRNVRTVRIMTHPGKRNDRTRPLSLARVTHHAPKRGTQANRLTFLQARKSMPRWHIYVTVMPKFNPRLNQCNMPTWHVPVQALWVICTTGFWTQGLHAT